MMEPILSVRGLVKRFGGLTAVDSLDLDVAPASITSVIGPNGAGKTTFFNLVTGFYQPDEGEILFQGRRIDGLSPDQITRQGIARTYQNIRLFANLTALENVLIGMHARLRSSWLGAVLGTRSTRREEAWAHEEALRLLAFTGLGERADVVARNLAYGEQRRLEIARALAAAPQLLLLDEPTAGMNPQETLEAARFIQRLRDELGITILLIEHDMQVVMGISNHVAVLDYGRKISEGAPGVVARDPRVIEAYLGRGAAELLAQVSAGDASGGDADGAA